MKPRAKIDTPQQLGHALAQGRLMAGLSQRDLAKGLGIEQKWVCEMEQGKPGLLTQRLFAILKTTGMHLYAEFDSLPDPDADSRENSHA
ncbi:MAG: helix-turn-helix domain-containing protein [Clostridiales Family XIII bacterium]|jgi:transcriptional regulator with XRE-family HTH domain|nr:helix-turn-helix domain-containing protein [Clostridiales Family XIII bacterium]